MNKNKNLTIYNISDLSEPKVKKLLSKKFKDRPFFLKIKPEKVNLEHKSQNFNKEDEK